MADSSQDNPTSPGKPTALAAEAFPRAFGDRYTLDRELARGGMGRVYVGTDHKLGRAVAIKVLSASTHDDDSLRRFEQEARTTGSLQHANMVAVFDAGQHEGKPYIVMELLQGATLRKLLEAGPLPIRQSLDYALQIARGLMAAHDKGIVHRDLKPDNLFVTGEGLLKILDFGVVKLLGQEAPNGEVFETPQGGVARAPRTQTGAVVGTIGYMSPEQVRGQPVDHGADIFSFGTCLYEMLAGRRAFHRGSAVETAYAILTADPEPLPPTVPFALRRLVSRCLKKKRQERPQSARELADELEALLQRAPTAQTQQLTGRALALFERRKRLLAPAVLVLALCGLSTAAWLALRKEPPARGPVSTKVRTIAVLPFVVRGDAQFAYLGEGMVDLMSTNLAGAGALRAVDPAAIIPAARLERGAIDNARAQALAKRFGAGLYVVGSVLEVEKRLHVHASLYDSEAPAESGQPVAEARAEGHTSQLFHLVDQITSQLRSHLGDGATPAQGPGGRLGRLAQLTTHSPEALKLYLEGEAALRRSSFRGARESLEKAIALDPEFALAHYRLAVATSISDAPRADQALKDGLQHSSRLSVRDRALLEAYAAFRQGRVDEAERQYRALTRDNPDEVEAFWWLGELLIHFNPLRGRPLQEAEGPLGRVLVLDPQHGGALTHSIDLALLQRDRQIVVALADRALANIGDEPGLAMPLRWMRAWAVGDEAARSALLDELRRTGTREDLQQILYRAAFEGDGLRDATMLAQVMSERGSDEERADGLRALATIALARGKRRAARDGLARAARQNPGAEHEYERLWVDTLPFLPVPAAELAQDREAARVLGSPAGAGLPLTRAFIETSLSLRLPAAEATQAIEAFARLPGASPDVVTRLRGRAAAAAGHPAEALAFFDRMELRVAYANSGNYAPRAEPLLRAEMLLSQGKLDEALRWADSFSLFGNWELAYLAPRLLLRGRILEKLGRKADAAVSLRRYLELRQDCDDELRPELLEVQRLLKGLDRSIAQQR